jgi:uncharacterized protein YfdQ (DUF2303 family)
MDKSGIEAIGQLAVEAAKAGELQTDTPALVLRKGDGQQVVSIEHLQPGRSRFRGMYRTNALAAFIALVIASSKDVGRNALTFINPENMSATAFFNLGDFEHPGHADHQAVLGLKPTAAYAALQASVDKPLDQSKLHTFLEDWRDFIVPVYEGVADAKRFSSALAAIRSVTIETARKVTMAESDFGAQKSAMESIDAKSEHTLPGGFLFTTVPYEGLPSRVFNLRLGVQTSTANERIGLVLRVMQGEKVLEDIAGDFHAALSTGLGDASSLFIGTFTP